MSRDTPSHARFRPDGCLDGRVEHPGRMITRARAKRWEDGPNESRAGRTPSSVREREHVGAGRTREHAAADHPPSQLQRTHGNRAVQRLVSERVRPTLEVDEPGDRYEREAERVAEQVTRGPGEYGAGPRVQRTCARCRARLRQGKPLDCADCERRLQRVRSPGSVRTGHPRADRAVGGGCGRCRGESPPRAVADPAPVDVPPVVGEVVRSPGRPLEPSTRTFMEGRFGYGFDHVRVHTDRNAADSARALNARAYTVGADIVFAAGAFRPGTAAGRRLLAHELTHVVQQGVRRATPRSHGSPVRRSSGTAEPGLDTVRGQGRSPYGSRNPGLPVRISPTARGRVQRQPAFVDCNEYHRCTVIEAMAPAKRMVNDVISALEPVAAGTVTSGRIVNLLNVHFRVGAVDDAPTILRNFQRIAGELDRSVNYVCHLRAPPDCTSERGVVSAYTACAPGADVDLCPSFHALGCEERARQLVHEAVHHLGGDFCRDRAYVGEGRYTTLGHGEAMKNPDTYAQFAKMVSMSVPSCRDCSREIQLGGTRY